MAESATLLARVAGAALALVLALPLVAGAELSEARLDLEACESRAATASPDVRAARQAAEMAQARADEKGWAWFPRFDFMGYATVAPGSGRASRTEGGGTFEEWGAYVRLQVSGEMPLYTFGAQSAESAEARRRVDAAQARVARSIQQVTHDVRRAWWDHALARADEEVYRLGLERVRRFLARMDDMDEEDDPEADPTDRLRARVREAELSIAQREAQRRGAMALARLRQAMGEPPEAEIDLAEADLTPALGLLAPLAEYELLARMFNPGLRSARAEHLASRERLLSAERSLLPEIFLGGLFRFGYRGASAPQPSPFASDRDNSWELAAFLGVRVALDVPQGMARREHAEARVSHGARARERDEAALDLRVARRYGEVEDLLRRLPSLRDAARAARSWYDAREASYDLEMTSVRASLQALSKAVERQVALSRALRDLNVAVAALSLEVGVDISLLEVDDEGARLPPGLRLPPGFTLPADLPPALRERLLRTIDTESSP